MIFYTLEMDESKRGGGVYEFLLDVTCVAVLNKLLVSLQVELKI